jgi:NADH-quinone oxidoreductase subunit B
MAIGASSGAQIPARPGAKFGGSLVVGAAGTAETPENTFITRRDSVVNWCRKYSLWPMPFATACCGIELMAVGASRFDIARFGAEVMRFSPRQCDLLIVAGRVAMKMMPVLQRIWLQMPEPKWCISMGACASTGGVFDTYAVVQGIDRFIPVDVYIPGCPPRPEQILRALIDMQEKIQKGGTMTGHSGLPEMIAREKYLAANCSLGSSESIAQERGDEERFGYRLPGGAAPLGAEESH